MIRKIIAVIFKAPVILFLIAAFGASIYAAVNNIEGITYGAPLILGILLGLYFIGVIIGWKKTVKKEEKIVEYAAKGFEDQIEIDGELI